jgi:hypothetical protein
MEEERPSRFMAGLPTPLSELRWSSDFVMQSIEVLVVGLRDSGLRNLRPNCADSLVVGWPAGAKAEDIATRALADLGLQPMVLHSTSWRHSENEVLLTYLAIVQPETPLPLDWETVEIGHVDLARGGATTPPPVIGVGQVLEHALRHLAWLIEEDEGIKAALPGWKAALEGYVPEPFRALGTSN